MAVSGLGVTYAATGFLLVYSGLKNVTLKDELTSFLSGNVPVANPTGAPVIGLNSSGSSTTSTSSTTSSSSSSAPGASGSSISADALKYSGHCYSYGGAPGTNGKGCWDCSSFVNWVAGHDQGRAIPGYAAGKYNGSVHGPNTISWLAWSGVKQIGNKSSDAQAGDLCVWQTHMGIAIGGGKMISALNESLGTKVTSIDGIVTGEVLFVKRLK